MTKVTIVIGSSVELKDALNEWAVSHNMSANEAARRAISQLIGYDLANEKANRSDMRGRPKKYATDEERKQVYAEKARKKRQLGRDLVAQFRRQQAAADMQRFRETVERQYPDGKGRK